MNKEVKEKWLKALRSGNYRQGRNFLKTNSRYDGIIRHCCLGVLCEVAKKEGVFTSEHLDPDTNVFILGESADCELLPKEVAEWAELEENPKVSLSSKVKSAFLENVNPETKELLLKSKMFHSGPIELTYINDNYISFDKIALAIEEGL